MKYEHEIIRDLMPLCIDGLASQQSEAAVRAHIAECAGCAAEWEQMQKGIDTDKREAEEAKRYAETARRVRRHDRRVAACVLSALMMMTFLGFVIASYHDGARFSLCGAMKYAVLDLHGAEYTLYGAEIPEEKPEITYLGEAMGRGQHWGAVFPYNIPKNMNAQSFAIVKLPKKEQTLFCMLHADRSDPDRLFMWNSGGMTCQPLKVGINMIYTEDHPVSAAFYSTDDRVKQIQFTFINVQWTLELDENGFGVIPLRTGFGMEITDGTATDENGHVLYRTENTGEIDENGRKVTRWVKTE